MKALLICTTYNRDKCLQRALKFYLDQDYKGPSTLFIFNSGKKTELNLPPIPPHKEIILYNTEKEYNSVGEKYNTALSIAPSADIATSFDVDDIYLPSHITEGVKGMQRAYEKNKLAYKSKLAWFKYQKLISKVENAHEPSIFVDYKYLSEHGYGTTSVLYHNSWLSPLIQANKILVDPTGPSTYVCDWSGEIPVYKLSGLGEDTQKNFEQSQSLQTDTGSGVTSPISDKEAQRLYKQYQ